MANRKPTVKKQKSLKTPSSYLSSSIFHYADPDGDWEYSDSDKEKMSTLEVRKNYAIN